MKLPVPLLLGLGAPACPLVARELLRRDTCDPEHPLLVVVPTRESVRLLREQLALAAAAGGANGAVICPRIISAGQLAAGQAERVAPPQLQQAALSCVLRREAANFPHLLPQAASWSEGDFLAKAGQFCKLYTTLCHEGIAADGSGEAARALAEQNPVWQGLFSLYPLFCEELHRHGWCAPAEAPPLRLEAGARVILACVPSLSERARQLLESSAHDVEVWLHTNELHEGPGWFDAWGRPGENWLATPAEDVLRLDTPGWQQRFLVCGDLERMAEETARAAGRCGGKAVSVAVCDPGMESAVAEAFSTRYGVATVRPRGISFSASGWHSLLQLLTRQSELLEETGHRAAETASLSADCASALLRNPILCTGLGIAQASRAAKEADELMRRSLPATFGTLQQYAPPALRAALQPLGQWLSTTLASADGLLDGLSALAAAQIVEGGSTALADATAVAATFTEQVDAACRQLRDSGWAGELTVSACLKLLSSAGDSANAPRPPRALSLRGWLELAYAPEEHLVLAGLHDGIIPERRPASPYLTPQVEETLGLPRDTTRAARDAYLLRSLYCCRPGKVQAVFSLLNARRDPLFPSSCFFRLAPQEKLAPLVGHFFDRSRPIPATAQLPYDSTGWEYRRLSLPVEEGDVAALASMTLAQLGLKNPMEGKTYSPSILHQFLACPLRFWLARLNGMRDERVSPTQRDLESRDIGTYLHDALEDFVRRYPSWEAFSAAHPGLDMQVADDTLRLIEQELDNSFTRAYERRYGSPELLPRQFQCAAMRRRLRGYARLHLQLWQEGWEAATDAEGNPLLEHEVRWEFDGHPLAFRIDRIDRRIDPETGEVEYRVIDYKTGNVATCYKNHLEELPPPSERPGLHLLDAGLEPVVGPALKTVAKHAHLRWKDLQLPLYTAWALERFAGSRVGSAYIRLSSTPGKVRVLAWGDSPKDPHYFLARRVPPSSRYKEEVIAESLHTNALRWIRFGLKALAEGRCLASAEMLRWDTPGQRIDIFGDILALEPLGRQLLRFSTPTTTN